jgi:hypothetical protein
MRRLTVAAAGILAALALSSQASAQFTQNALGTITTDGTSVTIHASQIGGPRWFGLRVFTTPPGLMESHSRLFTGNTDLAYSGAAVTPSGVLCISDFAGAGSPTGGLAGPVVPEAAAAPLDRGIAMVGGFVGSNTGCAGDAGGDIRITMNTPGPIVQAFYGTFFGDSPAPWRGNAGDVTTNAAWWNLWGNFTDLGYGATG